MNKAFPWLGGVVVGLGFVGLLLVAAPDPYYVYSKAGEKLLLAVYAIDVLGFGLLGAALSAVPMVKMLKRQSMISLGLMLITAVVLVSFRLATPGSSGTESLIGVTLSWTGLIACYAQALLLSPGLFIAAVRLIFYDRTLKELFRDSGFALLFAALLALTLGAAFILVLILEFSRGHDFSIG
jgi:hypothetical protein